jgi:plasmid stabilization system protein ParE
MRVAYHPAVQRDVSRILRHYDAINKQLGDDFWEELDLLIESVAANPRGFHFESGQKRRRANLKRFPYHFLFREISDGIRITVVRHHRQHPEFGLRRP